MKNLDKIIDRLKYRSNSDLQDSHSTAPNKITYEDGIGALNFIKVNGGSLVAHACNLYCLGMKKNQESIDNIAFQLRTQMQKQFFKEKKYEKHAWKTHPLTNIAINNIFGEEKTHMECSIKLGIDRSTYSKHWHKYVKTAQDEINRLLTEGDYYAGEYFQQEKRD